MGRATNPRISHVVLLCLSCCGDVPLRCPLAFWGMGHGGTFEGLKHWGMNASHNCYCSRQWEAIAFIRSKLLKHRNTKKRIDMLQRREKKVNTMKSQTNVEEIKKTGNNFRTLNLQIKENVRQTMMKARSGESWCISAEINKTGPAIDTLFDQLWKGALVNIQMVPPPQNPRNLPTVRVYSCDPSWPPACISSLSSRRR